jgi:flagellar basal body-associated protein FliL
MRNAKAVTALFGSMLLAITLTAGMAVAQSGTADSTKDSTSQPSQPSQSSQPDRSSQPAAPSEMKQSQTDSRTDVRTENRSERVVETERTKLLGMDPMVAMIVGAVLFIIVIMAIVSMSKRSSTASVETTRRTSI